MWNKIFVALFVSFTLFFGIYIVAIKNKDDFSILENRDLAVLTPLSFDSWMNSSFQTSMEDVLADHFVKRNLWVQGYNRMQISLNKLGNKTLDQARKLFIREHGSISVVETSESDTTNTSNPPTDSTTSRVTPTSSSSEPGETTENPDPSQMGSGLEDNDGELDNDRFKIDHPDDGLDQNTPFSLAKLTSQASLLTINGEDRLVKGNLVFNEETVQSVEKNINFINQFQKNIDGAADVYAYFIMSPHHSNLIYPGNGIDVILPIVEKLEVSHDIFEVNSIADVARNYLRTDHHWNHVGAYKGYREIISLLCGDGEQIYAPVDMLCFSDFPFYGSISRTTAFSVDVTPDTLCKLEFNLPDYQLLVGGSTKDEYGNLSYYVEGDASREKGFDHYNFLYQKREDVIEFDTGRSDLDSVLIISDSMSNPIREPIAGHFNKSYFISLEIAHQDDPFFEIEEFLEEHPVDQVLFMLSFDNLLPDGEMQYAR